MALLKGVAVRYSCAGITVTGYANILVQSAKLDRSADMQEVVGSDGEVAGEVYSKRKKQIDIEFVPSDTTISAVNTAIDTLVPASGVTIVVGDSLGTLVDGNYIVDTASLNLSNTAPGSISISAHLYDAADISATIS